MTDDELAALRTEILRLQAEEREVLVEREEWGRHAYANPAAGFDPSGAADFQSAQIVLEARCKLLRHDLSLAEARLAAETTQRQIDEIRAREDARLTRLEEKATDQERRDGMREAEKDKRQEARETEKEARQQAIDRRQDIRGWVAIVIAALGALVGVLLKFC